MYQSTLNQIIKQLETIANQNGVIKSFQWDQLTEIYTESEMPFMWAFEDGATQSGVVISQNIKLLFMDLVKKDAGNKKEVSSDMMELAKTVVAKLRANNDYFILNEDSITYTFFYDEKFDNEAAGCAVDLILKIPMLYDLCEYPTKSNATTGHSLDFSKSQNSMYIFH